MSRRCRFSILIVASLAVLAIVSATSAAQPRAQAARTCFYRPYKYGYSYLTYLAVRNTSCTTGRYVAHKHGHVSGWSCHKRITAKGPVQYDASVTCKSGRRQVVWSFAQNTA